VWRPIVVDRTSSKYVAWGVIGGQRCLLYVLWHGTCVQLAVDGDRTYPVARYSAGCHGPVAVSPDGRHVLLTGGIGESDTVVILREGTDQRITVEKAGTATAVVVTRDWWAVAGQEPMVKAFGWDGRPLDGILLSNVDSDYFGVHDMALSPDGSLLVTSDDGGINQSELGTPRQVGEPAIRAFDLSGPATERWTLEGYQGPVTFSPDGATVLCVGCVLVDAATGEVRRRLKTAGDAAFLPDGRLLLLARGVPALCDLETGSLVPMPGPTARAKYLAVSPDGWFATSGDDGVVIWEPA
jgi:WD40 repeat protein